jgi:xanthine permease XanP
LSNPYPKWAKLWVWRLLDRGVTSLPIAPKRERDPHAVLIGMDDKLPLGQAALLGLQHVLSMFVGPITPALLIGHLLHWPEGEISYLVSMALVISGIASFIQIRRVGPIGSGLLSAQGTSFAFFGPLLEAGHLGGLPLMLGMSLASAPVSLIIGPLLPRLKHFFTPVVSGTVVLLIGLSLIPAAMMGITSGFGPGSVPWHGLAISVLTLGLIVILGSIRQPLLRMSAVVIALAVGYGLSALLGYLHPPRLEAPLVVIPEPFHFGMAFQWQLLIPFLFLYLVSSMETLGDVTATAHLSGLAIEGTSYWSRVRGAVMADGLNSVLAACFNSFPNTTYAQNNGVIQLTGVASRQVGYFMCGFLALFGLVPLIGNWIAIMPGPVFGGATLLLFGYVASSGLRILYHSAMTQREWMIVAVSLSTGLGVASAPTVLDVLPETIRLTFSSSVVTGGVLALLLNAVLPRSRLPETLETVG